VLEGTGRVPHPGAAGRWPSWPRATRSPATSRRTLPAEPAASAPPGAEAARPSGRPGHCRACATMGERRCRGERP
jgi:hypothetical protein